MELSPRKKRILQALIEDYIQNAEPVGSKALVERWGLDLSPATLRNEMAALEEMGYLEQPHTSAGRIPSPRGYRLFVNELMEGRRLELAERRAINDAMQLRIQELDKLIFEAGQLLSELTHYPAYALTPRVGAVTLLRFDLFATGEFSFMIVVATDPHGAKSKVVRLQFQVESDDLTETATVLNLRLVSRNLYDITSELWAEIAQELPFPAYLSPVRDFLLELSEEFAQQEVYISGQSHLLTHPEFRDIARAHRLLDYLSDRRELARLSMSDSTAPVQFLIGPENVAEQLRDSSVVMASYQLGNNLRGLIGIVGPTRMDYAMLTSRLSYFAKCLGTLLSQTETQELDEDEE